jgi:deferrochelatase/peroxidase EfeB
MEKWSVPVLVIPFFGLGSMLRSLAGTPVDESPHDDSNEDLHTSNNFDFRPVNKHDKCPFAAHIRKMRPRGDLEDDHAVIIRRGISYGGEVTPDEKRLEKSDPNLERGLLFVCYQSDIRNGFNFLTTREPPCTL